MVSLAGLSAVGKGYQEAEKSYQTSRLLEQEAALNQLYREGEAALGNTFKTLAGQGLVPGAQEIPGAPIGGAGNGPPRAPGAPTAPAPPSSPGMPALRPPPQTPPMPGQASVPMEQGGFNDRFRQADTQQIQTVGPEGTPVSPQGPAPAMPAQFQPPQGPTPQAAGMPGGQPRVAGPPGIPQPQQQFDLNTAATLIARTNPGIRPEVLVHALGKAMPYLNAQAQNEVKQLLIESREYMNEQRLRTSERNTDVRVQSGERNVDVKAGVTREGQDKRLAGQLITTGARSADKAADRESREFISGRSEEGKAYRAELRAETQKDLAKYNRETRLELQEYAQNGRLDLKNLSIEGQKALKAMDAATREKIEASRSLDRGESVRARREIAGARDVTTRRGQDIVSEDKAKGTVSREAVAGMRDDTQRDLAGQRDVTTRRGQDISSADRAAGREQRQGFFEQRDETTRRGQDLTAEGRTAAREQRGAQFQQSEDRRVAAQAWKQDTQAQRFEQKHAELEQRAKLAGNRQEAAAIATEARAEHNRVMEYLQINNMFNTLKPTEKKALAAEINSKYDSLISRLRTQSESTRGDRQPVGGGPRVVPTTSVRRPGSAEAAPVLPPDAMKALQEAPPGSTLNSGGKKYRLENGRVVEVQ